MRLIVARCSVAYTGRLTAHLPEALRLIMLKADGSVLVHADAGGYKPLNWMTPPTAVIEDGDTIVVRKIKGEDQLEITLHEVISDIDHLMDFDADRLSKDGVEADLQIAARRGAALLRRGLPARAPRVADRHRPGGPDVPRRGRRLDRGRDQARRHDRRRRAALALPGADPARPGQGDCRGVLAAQTVKPQARVLAESRGLAWVEVDLAGAARRARARAHVAESRGLSWVEVDLAVLRGEREPALTLFG